MTNHPLTVAFPFPIVLAEAVGAGFSWTQTLVVYGPLGLWVLWFVIRDKMDRDERKIEKEAQERRHQENLAASKRIEEAFRTHTDLLIVGLAGMKTIDVAYSMLLEKIEKANHPKPH